MSDVRHLSLGPGREFDIVRALERRWGSRAAGLGDDAAVLALPAGERLVVSTDASIEGVHFRTGWLGPRDIGYRATTAALSDLAAMGALPLGVLVALVLPRAWVEYAPELADGVGEAVECARTVIVGGDLTGGGELALTVTVLGHAVTPLTRGGARPGDAVYITGTLGGPLAAVRAWSEGAEPSAAARARFAHPAPRIAEARWLADHGADAAIDISDGLVADLGHIAAASGVTIVVDLDLVPRLAEVSAVDAGRSGEEYELALTAPAGLDTAAFARAFGIPLTHIGRVEAGRARVEAIAQGVRVASPSGFDHFT